MGCATVLMSKRLNITLYISTVAEYKYNGVKKTAGYIGSNPIIFTKMNEYRLLGDKVIRNHIRGMDYEGVGIIHDHAYTKVSVRKKR